MPSEFTIIIHLKINRMQQTQKTKLMRLSWTVQRTRKCNRSKALTTAWAIFQNEDVTLHYLTRRYSHSHEGYNSKVNPNALTLFGS